MTDRQHEKKSRAGQDRGQDRGQNRGQNRRQNRRQGAVYQGAFEAVIALLISIGLGYWLDGYFDTAPWLLLMGTAIGFASFTVRLIRLGRWMKAEDPDEARKTGESE